MKPRVRVMLVDDHAIVRSGFRRLLEQYPDIEVIGEASNAEDAYHEYARLGPEVMVLDLSMPGAGGIDSLRRVLSRDPSARIIVFSMHEDAPLAQRALDLGARGYVTKSSAPEVLAEAVLAVAAGGRYLSADIANAVAQFNAAGREDVLDSLSAREYEIFRQLVAGHSGAEIAAALNLSAKTVANYHTAIKQKLNVSSDVELVRLAMRLAPFTP
ncbi:MAG: response regulator transcription factor [Steroidobacteraceae bacterium]